MLCGCNVESGCVCDICVYVYVCVCIEEREELPLEPKCTLGRYSSVRFGHLFTKRFSVTRSLASKSTCRIRKRLSGVSFTLTRICEKLQSENTRSSVSNWQDSSIYNACKTIELKVETDMYVVCVSMCTVAMSVCGACMCVCVCVYLANAENLVACRILVGKFPAVKFKWPEISEDLKLFNLDQLCIQSSFQWKTFQCWKNLWDSFGQKSDFMYSRVFVILPRQD